MIDWDDAFENSAYVAGSAEFPKLWAQEADQFRQSHGKKTLDIAYGDHPRQVLDVFEPDGPAQGTVVFTHGGYWRLFDKSYWSHLAQGCLAHGWRVAIPSYRLAPEARISDIVQDVAKAIIQCANTFSGPLRLTGHSAGGHLVARMAAGTSPLPDEVYNRVENVVPISGVYHLTPLCDIKMNETLQLSEQEAREQSPVFLPVGTRPMHLWVGASERPEFLRQTRMFAEHSIRSGLTVPETYDHGMNHFSVVLGLKNHKAELVCTLLGLKNSK